MTRLARAAVREEPGTTIRSEHWHRACLRNL
jgi:hypothetical protein